MSRRRRALSLLAALVLLGLATVLALIAVDARAWRQTLTQGDLRFRVHHAHAGLWHSPAMLPGDPARVILGLGDALSYRQGLQLFWFTRAGSNTGGQANLSAAWVAAGQRLQNLVDTAATPVERSTAANLLGVMAVTAPAANSPTRNSMLARAALYFKRAIAENPANSAAKINLELVLRIRASGKSKLNEDAAGGFGSGGFHGAGVTGGGF